MALGSPPPSTPTAAKDCMLYALGVGLGLDPMNEDELAFVYEKNLKALPTMAAVLGYPGFWARDLDTGIDWVRIVNGEQGFVLHRPLNWHGTVIGMSRSADVVDKGAGKGAIVACRAHGLRQSHWRAARDHRADDVLPRRRRLRRSAARATAGARIPGARAADRGVRSRSRPEPGAAHLPALRRPQSAACRSGGRAGRRFPAPDPARARDFRRRRARRC